VRKGKLSRCSDVLHDVGCQNVTLVHVGAPPRQALGHQAFLGDAVGIATKVLTNLAMPQGTKTHLALSSSSHQGVIPLRNFSIKEGVLSSLDMVIDLVGEAPIL
jgi:hypothetical protein